MLPDAFWAERVVSVWVDWVMMIIVIIVMVLMAVFISVMVMMQHIQTAYTRTKGFTEFTCRNVRSRRLGTLAFNMMVMALLRQANFRLEA